VLPPCAYSPAARLAGHRAAITAQPTGTAHFLPLIAVGACTLALLMVTMLCGRFLAWMLAEIVHILMLLVLLLVHILLMGGVVALHKHVPRKRRVLAQDAAQPLGQLLNQVRQLARA
jgi:hypothetical protein